MALRPVHTYLFTRVTFVGDVYYFIGRGVRTDLRERERKREKTKYRDKYFFTRISLFLGSSRYRKKKKKKIRGETRPRVTKHSHSARHRKPRTYLCIHPTKLRAVLIYKGHNFIAHTYIIARECLECYQVGGKTVRLKSAVSKFCGYPTRCEPQEHALRPRSALRRCRINGAHYAESDADVHTYDNTPISPFRARAREYFDFSGFF